MTESVDNSNIPEREKLSPFERLVYGLRLAQHVCAIKDRKVTEGLQIAEAYANNGKE
jgi:hypothetical protein